MGLLYLYRTNKTWDLHFRCTTWMYQHGEHKKLPNGNNQGRTNPWRQSPYICGSSVWNFLHVYHLALRLLMWFIEFWKICVPLEIILGYRDGQYLSRPCSLLISTKCKAALFTIWWHMRGMETQLHSFLTSALDGDEWSPSRSDHFTPGKKNHRHPPNENVGGSRCCSGGFGREKNRAPAGTRKHLKYAGRFSPIRGIEVAAVKVNTMSVTYDSCWSH